jgi:hypothetical protein
MESAHLRLGRLDYRRSTGKIQTRVSLHVDHYMGEEGHAHLISLFGSDAEVGAVSAAIQEDHRFELFFPEGSKQTVAFGKDPSTYRGSLTLPGQKRPLRHLLAVSASLHANGSAGRTFILNYQQHTREAAWATLVSLQGLPAEPRWGEYVLAELARENKIKPIVGIGCAPAALVSTRTELLERIGRARASGLLPFPEKSGPVVWPRFALRQILAPA